MKMEARAIVKRKSPEFQMGKIMRRESSISISSCSSPHSSFFVSPHSPFIWYEDIWIEIAKYLDGKCLMKLAMTNRWFHRVIMEECVWKFAILRELNVPPPKRVTFKWAQIYASTYDGGHSYRYHQQEKHIDWMRIGGFFFDSPYALVTDKLLMPKKIQYEESTQEMLRKTGVGIILNVKTGIWIADLQLVRCPVCNLNTCEGTMQTLDARHLELFLHEEYKEGTWGYDEIGSLRIEKHCHAASAGIFDVRHFKSSCTKELFDVKSWVGKPEDWQPRARINIHGVAISTNLQTNEGLMVKYQVMRAGVDGPVVSIRVSQQLV